MLLILILDFISKYFIKLKNYSTKIYILIFFRMPNTKTTIETITKSLTLKYIQKVNSDK